MNQRADAAAYEAWYHTRRGRWIAEREFALLQGLLNPLPHASLLDVGCGTGYFSRRFAAEGFAVTGLDPDSTALDHAQEQDGSVRYIQGSALALPFADGHFDHAIAITSLCFIDDPAQALREMWRVSRGTVLLGLLNRHSLLYRQKQGGGGYRGARWDSTSEVVNRWVPSLTPAPARCTARSAIFLPTAGPIARQTERWLPNTLPVGGFLAICLEK
jgi:ubiquinone/menaquinone biosynthesis C-methylase UbiE